LGEPVGDTTSGRTGRGAVRPGAGRGLRADAHRPRQAGGSHPCHRRRQPIVCDRCRSHHRESDPRPADAPA